MCIRDSSSSGHGAWSGWIASIASLHPDSRIEQPVAQVHQQVDEDETRGNEQDGNLHQRIIPLVDRIDQQPADPRPAEHGLDDYRAAQQLSLIHISEPTRPY